MKILVTGGAGYIGSITAKLLQDKGNEVVVFDNLKGGHKESVSSKLVVGDLLSKEDISKGLNDENFDAVVHFAAETHVDRSILGPQVFLKTNIIGTQVLLDAALNHKIKRLHYIGTDEVFGALPLDSKLKFNEKTLYNPRSPYSASKAAAEAARLTGQPKPGLYRRLLDLKGGASG